MAEGINDGLIEDYAGMLHAGGYDVFFELGALYRGAPAWRFGGAILIQALRPDLVHDLDARRVPYVCACERYDTLIALTTTRHMKIVPGHDVPFASAKAFLTIAVVENKATAVLCYDHRIAIEVLGAATSMKLRGRRT